MEISKTKNAGGNGIILKASGKLSSSTSEEFDAALNSAIEETANIVLDFAELDYLASAGLRCLISAHKKIRARQGTLSIINVAGEVREVFEITGLEDVFDLK
ncbi:MAG: STAS domain-containing protein [Treponema sp.]|jgi:anti-anti-sigma factor|nr:STAS domain-containing protein [Treponema sp.]